ncbi:MAG: CCA tRNA nucleotidyltransferase [Pseudomonadota bacterium]
MSDKTINTFIQHIPNYKKLLYIIKNMQYNNQYPRLVGGCIRDILLKKQITDIDIATPAPPETIIKQIQALKGQAIPTGLQHGTITGVFYLKCNTKITIEFTTLRIDLQCDGRYANIEFTQNFQKDAERRDLTINAMSYCLIQNLLFDYFNGYNDLKNNIIKFINDPHQRIKEDYLRILRFFRFAAYYGYKNNNIYLDSQSYQACISLAQGMKQLSQERITNEIIKLITGPYNYHILQKMLPILKYINMNNVHIHLLKHVQKPSIETALSLLYYKQYSTLKLIKLSNKQLRNIKQIHEILNLISFDVNYNNFNNSKNTTTTHHITSTNHIISQNPIQNQNPIQQYINSIQLLHIKKLAIKKTEIYQDIIHILSTFKYLSSDQIDHLNELYNSSKQFPINGHDLIKLGYHGQEIATKLNELEDIWINNKCVNTKNELLKNLQPSTT